MNDKKTKIIGIIKIKGPVVPSDVSKMIGLDLLIASALLSEMVGDKMLQISHIKVGGSPLYFLSEQKMALENFINLLQPKERAAFELLRQKEILDDSKLEPAIRIALREIKDFAVPIRVAINNNEHLFWRFYSIPSDSAIERIREIVSKYILRTIKKQEEQGEKHEKKAKKHEKKEEKIGGEKTEEKVVEEKPEEKQVMLTERVKKIKKSTEEKVGALREVIGKYAEANNIKIMQEIKAEKDCLQFIALIKSSIGQLTYLLILKSKKKISDADISLAYHDGQEAKLPVLFITTGEMTKKASSYAESLKGSLIFRKL